MKVVCALDYPEDGLSLIRKATLDCLVCFRIVSGQTGYGSVRENGGGVTVKKDATMKMR